MPNGVLQSAPINEARNNYENMSNIAYFCTAISGARCNMKYEPEIAFNKNFWPWPEIIWHRYIAIQYVLRIGSDLLGHMGKNIFSHNS